jgi:NAD(P)-dependent dehydrogenase (short-subunit alcohol dehydrogenase family)
MQNNTGAGGGIGSGLVEAFLKEGYNVVGTPLTATQTLTASPSLALVYGDIGHQETAAKSVEAAITQFGTIDVLVNNAGIFFVKPFTEFTTKDLNALVSTNLFGFLYITQPQYGDASTRSRVCKGRHSLQRRRAGRRGYTAASE